MNKKVRGIAALLISMLLLTGCGNGTGNEADGTREAAVTPSETTVEATLETTESTLAAVVETDYTGPAPGSLNYEEYQALSAEDQEAYYNQFASFDEFISWYNNAEAEYLASIEANTTENTLFEENLEDWE